MAPVGKKSPKFNEISGQMFPTLPVPGPESFELSLPMFSILEGNGLGPLLTCMLGDDTLSTLLVTYVFKHSISWESLS